ncbi:hypothetical protein TRAPUB_14251 [Trametes pubescens]|uniref:Uncharacterized protein n=1 Tax=Trametes pubescens TaxID=154538 RepID=A0A1M2VNZ8_TRAPU|nr:hypothetical protein TRAPUB_14251 [Trametes pubescens]
MAASDLSDSPGAYADNELSQTAGTLRQDSSLLSSGRPNSDIDSAAASESTQDLSVPQVVYDFFNISPPRVENPSRIRALPQPKELYDPDCTTEEDPPSDDDNHPLSHVTSMRDADATTMHNADATTMHDTANTTSMRDADATSMRDADMTSMRNADVTSMRNADATSMRDADATSMHDADVTSMRDADASSVHTMDATTMRDTANTTSMHAADVNSVHDANTNSACAEANSMCGVDCAEGHMMDVDADVDHEGDPENILSCAVF